MTTLAAPTRVTAPTSLPLVAALFRSRWLWCLLASLFVAVRALASGDFNASLGDTDDATRLVQVREWIAGAGWYDLLLPRFGGATPLLSHWSRLIDVPIAALLFAFGLVLTPEAAEVATRIVWPSLLLVVLLRLLVAEAERRAGMIAGLLALALAMTMASGVYQFRLGRLDHHNIMNLLTVGGLLMLARSAEAPRVALGAGAMLGLALTIGYEPLLLIVPVVAVLGLSTAFITRWAIPARNATAALAAVLCLGLATAMQPALWHLSPCDAIGLNLVLLVACGALAVAVVAAWGARWSPLARLAVLSIGVGAGVAAYIGANPVCLGGPFGAVSAEAKTLWLNHVTETTPLYAPPSYLLVASIAYLVLAVATIAAAAYTWSRDKSETALATLAIVAIVLPLSALQAKFVAYGSLLAVVPLAVAIARLDGGGRMTPLSARLAALLAVNQPSISILATVVLMLFGTPKAVLEGSDLKDVSHCHKSSAIKPLDTLPRGLMVAPVDFGPFIVALTRHDVLAAPYHRIDAAIVENFHVFRAAPEVAEQKLAALKADYLVTCLLPPRDGKPVVLGSGITRSSLLGRLAYGETVPFLTEIVGASPEPTMRVWRIERANAR